MAEPARSQPTLVRRLTFTSDGEHIELVSEQQVRMIPPPSLPVDHPLASPGVSAVLRDNSGVAVYRRAVDHALQSDVEVFSPEPGKSLSRAPIAGRVQTFTVLVPALATDSVLEFIGVAAPILPGPAPAGAPPALLPRPVARFAFPPATLPGQEASHGNS